MTPTEAIDAMPKRIKIGPIVYSVNTVEVVDGNDTASDALIHIGGEYIEIIKNPPSASALAGHLLHEILHGIWDDRGLGKRPGEERVVLQFEAGLIALFKDNPHLLKWIDDALR